ncbi:hypothetical protein HAX39_25645 [Citrobacter freundii]|nr:hypothetical protein [Citrobacter freundii]
MLRYNGPMIYTDAGMLLSQRPQGSIQRPAWVSMALAAPRSLSASVAAWAPDIARRFDKLSREPGAGVFCKFLDRLHLTKAAQTGESLFRTQVAALLSTLPDSPPFSETVFSIAIDATTQCHDKVSLTWNLMQQALLAHQAQTGSFDHDLSALVKAGREMFRLERLAQLAAEKVNVLQTTHQSNHHHPAPDEIEVFLRFQTGLQQTLALHSVAPGMLFTNLGMTTNDELAGVAMKVKNSENSQFSAWFAQWQPFHEVLQRTQPERWKTAMENRDALVEEEAFNRRLEAGMDKYTQEITDARDDPDIQRIVGAEVMQAIRLETCLPLLNIPHDTGFRNGLNFTWAT